MFFFLRWFYAPRPRRVNVPAFMAAGSLKISPAAWKAADGACIEAMERYYRGDWGRLLDSDRRERPGFWLMAAYTVGEARLLVLMDERMELVRMVLDWE